MGGSIGVGIIGTGKHGSRYAKHIVEDLGSHFHLAAISRRSAAGQDQALAWDTTFYGDWRDLVRASEVEAVISAVTPNLNSGIGELCAAMGKPLLLEKPLTTDFPAGQNLVTLFARAGVPLTVGQTLRYNSVIGALRQNLPRLGRLFSFAACQRLEPSTMGWLEQPEIAGGGVIFHTAVHLFDALRYITGAEIVQIRATAGKVYNRHLEDIVIAEVILGNGCLGTIDASKVSPARAGRYEFVGEHGQLHGDQVHGILEKIEGTRITTLPVTPPGPTILPLLQDWHALLTGAGDNPIPGGEGLAAIKVCHACRKAVETGRWVTIGEV